MKLLRILVTDKIANEGITYLKDKGASVKVKKLSRGELKDIIGDFDAIIVRSTTKVDKEILRASQPRLKVVGRAGVGVDNIDLAEATRIGVLVVNSPYSNTVTTAELTIAHILSMSRKIPQAYCSMKSGKWEKKKFMGIELRGKVLGIIGLGRIGSYVAKLANGIGMKVVGYDPFANIKEGSHIEVVKEISELLKSADIITVHVPLNKNTYHLIGKEEISEMKDGVILVNCARGGIIDENAMLEALKSGKLTGVSLDVFEEEPPPPSELILHPNVITTPHIGASTIEAQKNVSLEVAEQVWLALNGKPVKTAVNMPISSTKEFDVLKEHILLAETMGKFMYQTSPENLKEVEFEYSGFLTEYNTAILTASFLKGLLSSIVAGNINLINAIPIAKERGIKLKETKGGRDYGLNNLICVKMNTTNPIKEIGGSILPTNEMRIVILNGHRVNMEPFGYILLTKHMDEPGIVGKIGTILGGNNINIASLQLARSKPREEAIMLLSVDEEVKDDVLEKISKIKGMEYVRFVNLKGREVK